MEITCSNNRVLITYAPSLALRQSIVLCISPFYIVYNIFNDYKMLRSKDLESYIKVKEFMTMNGMKGYIRDS